MTRLLVHAAMVLGLVLPSACGGREGAVDRGRAPATPGQEAREAVEGDRGPAAPDPLDGLGPVYLAIEAIAEGWGENGVVVSLPFSPGRDERAEAERASAKLGYSKSLVAALAPNVWEELRLDPALVSPLGVIEPKQAYDVVASPGVEYILEVSIPGVAGDEVLMIYRVANLGEEGRHGGELGVVWLHVGADGRVDLLRSFLVVG